MAMPILHTFHLLASQNLWQFTACQYFVATSYKFRPIRRTTYISLMPRRRPSIGHATADIAYYYFTQADMILPTLVSPEDIFARLAYSNKIIYPILSLLTA